MMEKHVLMFSGGLDSYLAYLFLLDNGISPIVVYCAMGHSYQEEEIRAVKKLQEFHPDMDLYIDTTLSGLGEWEQEGAFIPNRNAFLALAGSLYGRKIWFGIMDGEQSFPDCKQDTFLYLSILATKLQGFPVIVDSPFWDLTKAEVINRLNPDYYSNLLHTTSCYHGNNCGNCKACFRRWVAFELNDIQDSFKVNPWETELAAEYLEKAKKKEYGNKRSKEIIKALRKKGIK